MTPGLADPQTVLYLNMNVQPLAYCPVLKCSHVSMTIEAATDPLTPCRARSASSPVPLFSWTSVTRSSGCWATQTPAHGHCWRHCPTGLKTQVCAGADQTHWCTHNCMACTVYTKHSMIITAFETPQEVCNVTAAASVLSCPWHCPCCCPCCCPAAAPAAAEDIATKRPEWSHNRLEQHLTEVLRQLGDAFANAAGNRGAAGTHVPHMHLPTAAGIDLLQVRRNLACDVLTLV